jgi:biotin-(acetyl-CoA carboxylase) ligase
MEDALAAPDLPPLLHGRQVEASQDAFAAALAAVRQGEAAAGDLFWSQAVERLGAAFVFEPEVAARVALQVHYAVMVAIGDALGAIGPPELAVHYRWPGTLLVNGAVAGEARTALSETADEEAVPRYMVTGFTLAIQPPPASPEPGLALETTALWEEGCGDLDRNRLVESIARYVLTWIDTWQNEGFRPVHEMWCGRAEGRIGLTQGERDDRVFGLDEDGNLLLKSEGGTRALRLIDRIERF